MWDKRWLVRSGGLLVLLGFVLPTMTVSCGGLSGFGRTLSLYDLASLANVPMLYLVPVGALTVVILAFLPIIPGKNNRYIFWGQAAGATIGLLSLIGSFLSLRSQMGQVGFDLSIEIGGIALAAGYILVYVGLAMQYSQNLSINKNWQWSPSQPERAVQQNWSPSWSPPKGKPPYLEETLPPFPEESQSLAQETIPPPPVAGPRGSLHLLKGNLPYSTIILDHDDFTIGRGSTNDLLLEDRTVSRQHVRLRYAQGSWYIQDLQSTAGIYVNGETVAAQRLTPGDEITIGNYLFEYQNQ